MRVLRCWVITAALALLQPWAHAAAVLGRDAASPNPALTLAQATALGKVKSNVPHAEPAPMRIISLLPSLTESVCMLNACDRLVAVDRHSTWPEAVRHLPKLGSGLDDAPVEAILALRPDLVLAAPSSRAVERMRALGLKVLALPTDTQAQVREALHELAARLGHPQAAASAWAGIDRQMSEAAAAVPARLRGHSVYFEVSSEPYAASESSFIGQTLQRLGLRNVVGASLGAFPRLNPEFVVQARPDVIMGSLAEVQQMHARPGWRSLAALRSLACGFTPSEFETLVRPGPRLGEAAGLIAACLKRLDDAH